MQGAMLRHQQPATGRNKPVPRGASRMVAKEPLSARLPKANFSVADEATISAPPKVDFGTQKP